jgi:DNA-binding winged helix-turn-helix (wHTH) protein
MAQSGAAIRDLGCLSAGVQAWVEPNARQFNSFTFLSDRALLLRDGQEIRIGSRALDLLGCLLEQAGSVVDKRILMRKVWPTTIVEEVSLRVQLAALRKALGDGKDGARYIINVPGRGYRFVAPVSHRHVKFNDRCSACGAPERIVLPLARNIANIGAIAIRDQNA